MDYTEQLRRLATSDPRAAGDLAGFGLDRGDLELDPKTLALARIAALVAMGAAEPSFGSLADTAVGEGATAAEIVDVLVGIIDVVGVPRVVAAAPKLALALGHDLEEGGTSEWRG